MRRLLLVLLVLCFGCGGGTSSTGDPGTRITKSVMGRVLDTSDQALAGVAVHDAVGGAQAVSDASGSFQLEAVLEEDSIELIFDSNSTLGTAILPDIPVSTTQIVADFRLDDAQGIVSVISVDYEVIGESGKPLQLLDSQTSSPRTLSSPTPKPTSSTVLVNPPHPIVTPTPNIPASRPVMKYHVFWQGTIVDNGDVTVPNVSLIVPSLSQRIVTDNKGRFSFVTDTQDDPFSLEIKYGCKTVKIYIASLPANRDINVRVKLELAYARSDDYWFDCDVIAHSTPTPLPGVPPISPAPPAPFVSLTELSIS